MRSLDALAFFTLVPTSRDGMFVSTIKTKFDEIFEMRLDDVARVDVQIASERARQRNHSTVST